MEEINIKEICENKYPIKITNIVEKMFNFSQQKKGKERPPDLATHLKILTTKQMLQKLPIVLA